MEQVGKFAYTEPLHSEWRELGVRWGRPDFPLFYSRTFDCISSLPWGSRDISQWFAVIVFRANSLTWLAKLFLEFFIPLVQSLLCHNRVLHSYDSISLTEVHHPSLLHVSCCQKELLPPFTFLSWPVLKAYRYLTPEISSNFIHLLTTRDLAERLLRGPPSLIGIGFGTPGKTCCQMHGLLNLIALLTYIAARRGS